MLEDGLANSTFIDLETANGPRFDFFASRSARYCIQRHALHAMLREALEFVRIKMKRCYDKSGWSVTAPHLAVKNQLSNVGNLRSRWPGSAVVSGGEGSNPPSRPGMGKRGSV